jgi:hypothetical protein
LHVHNSLITCYLLQIGERTATILKHLFPVPKPDSKRIITFANRDDYISFRYTFHYLCHVVFFCDYRRRALVADLLLHFTRRLAVADMLLHFMRRLTVPFLLPRKASCI